MRRSWSSIALTVAIAVLAIVYACPPGEYSFYPPCLIKWVTGLNCPGCGATRALHALLHLRFAEAFALNPFFTGAAPLLAAWTACALRPRS